MYWPVRDGYITWLICRFQIKTMNAVFSRHFSSFFPGASSGSVVIPAEHANPGSNPGCVQYNPVRTAQQD
jgi:hypothetical protein